jgi:peptidylamidoglycolate lyase
MIKKSAYFISSMAALLFLAYFLQPVKKGKGIDATIKYELVNNWPNLPANIQLGNPTGIGLDTNQNIVVFHRAGREWPLLGPMPNKVIQHKTILIIDKNNGQLLNSWGDSLFIMPHGLTVDNESNVWVTDVGLHQLFKFNHDGKLLMKLGEAKVAGNDSLHFNKPTDIAIAKDGSFYVSDGYGNSRVIKFSATGKYLFEWGKKGNGEGEFDIPHGITIDKNDNVFVADRENNRIQEFDPNGRFIRQFINPSFGSICSVAFDKTQSKLFAVDDFTFLKLKHRGSDVFVIDSTGNIQTRFGRSGSYSGKIAWYHDLTIDAAENIFLCDILGNTIQKFRKTFTY